MGDFDDDYLDSFEYMDQYDHDPPRRGRRRSKGDQVECDVTRAAVWSELVGNFVPGVKVVCSRCEQETEAAGVGPASVTRCLATLREVCPHGENNYYVGKLADEPEAPKKSRATKVTRITEFRGKHSFLSNFHRCLVPYDGRAYPSVENAFQAAKGSGTEEEVDQYRARLVEEPNPGEARKWGKRAKLRRDWELVRANIMTQLVLTKFAAHPDLRVKLVSTGTAELIEGNTWGDHYWGAELVAGEWVGDNVLGRILMGVREKLR